MSKPEDVVLYLAPLGAISAVSFLTISSQCTAAPLDPGLKAPDITSALEQLKPKCLVVFGGIDGTEVWKAASQCSTPLYVAEASPTISGLFKFVDGVSGAHSCQCLRNPAEGVGLLLRTSGTTSKPKVVPLKLGSIIANSQAIAASLHLSCSDVALNAMPLFHIGGISANLLSSLVTGGTVICMPEFEPPDFIKILIKGSGVTTSVTTSGDYQDPPLPPQQRQHEQRSIIPTWYSAVPSMHVAVTEYVDNTFPSPSQLKHSLRFIRSGAARLTHEQLLRIETVFGVSVVSTYSMTELMPISQPPTIPLPGEGVGRLQVDSRPDSVGRPIIANLVVVDEGLQALPFGTRGEVCISGNTVFEGYADNPQANASSFFEQDGDRFFRTGDMVRSEHYTTIVANERAG